MEVRDTLLFKLKGQYLKGDLFEIVLDTIKGELLFYHNGTNYHDRVFRVPKGTSFIPAVTLAKKVKASFVECKK